MPIVTVARCPACGKTKSVKPSMAGVWKAIHWTYSCPKNKGKGK